MSMTQHQANLDSWTWINPCDPSRFERRRLQANACQRNEKKLENILRIADRVFDDLSVMEQFYAGAEGDGRAGEHARADRCLKVNMPEVASHLAEAERHLWSALEISAAQRQGFVDRQVARQAPAKEGQSAKLHLGSAGYLIPGWINVDGGGADLMANLNWGLPFPDASARYIYSSHMLEHLRYGDQAPVFLRDVLRTLEPHGVARFVVPDVRKLLRAYVEKDRNFFSFREEFYRLDPGFLKDGIPTLDYILLFCGAAPQMLSYNHKFGYDSETLCDLLRKAGFARAYESAFQGSEHPELRVDGFSYNTRARDHGEDHYSLFVEAVK